MQRPVALLGLVLALGATGCSTLGVPVPGSLAANDFGARQELRVCLLRESSVSEARAQALIAGINGGLAPYGIEVVVPWMRPWERPGYTSEAIVGELAARPLEPPCDRLVALLGRPWTDVLLGLVVPEALGGVETTTRTRGYGVASGGSLKQLLTPPGLAARHEFHHLLGCLHALTRSACYAQIAALKRARADNREDFFPGVAPGGMPIRTRAEVDARLGQPAPQPPS
jgi:hypothetical protein